MADHNDQRPENQSTSANGSHGASTQFFGRHLWQYAVVQDIFWISSIIGLLVIGYLLRSVLTPILIAFGLAYVLNPIVTTCQERFHIPRVASIVSMLMLFVTTILVAIWLLGPILATEIDQLLHRWPDYQNRIMSYIDNHNIALQEWIKRLVPTDGQPVAGALAGKAPRGLKLLSQAFSTTAYVVACCILTPIFYFFFAWRFDEYLQYVLRLVPNKHRDEVRSLAKKMDAVVGNYIRGRVIASLFLCAGFSFCWWIADVPYSLALGIVTGILGAAPWVSTVGLPIAIMLKYSDVVAD